MCLNPFQKSRRQNAASRFLWPPPKKPGGAQQNLASILHFVFSTNPHVTANITPSLRSVMLFVCRLRSGGCDMHFSKDCYRGTFQKAECPARLGSIIYSYNNTLVIRLSFLKSDTYCLSAVCHYFFPQDFLYSSLYRVTFQKAECHAWSFKA